MASPPSTPSPTNPLTHYLDYDHIMRWILFQAYHHPRMALGICRYPAKCLISRYMFQAYRLTGDTFLPVREGKPYLVVFAWGAGPQYREEENDDPRLIELVRRIDALGPAGHVVHATDARELVWTINRRYQQHEKGA